MTKNQFIARVRKMLNDYVAASDLARAHKELDELLDEAMVEDLPANPLAGLPTDFDKAAEAIADNAMALNAVLGGTTDEATVEGKLDTDLSDEAGPDEE
jgi:hypothetical protein